MEKLIEIRIHGRGGQGGKSAAFIYALGCMKNGWHIKAFPEYGAEREGAPVRAFVRISKNPVKVHSNIYHPDYVVVLDKTLINESVLDGITSNTTVILNLDEEYVKNQVKSNKEIQKINKIAKTYYLDATMISLKNVGKNFPNIPMLGGLEKVAKLSSIEKLKEAIEEIKGSSWSEEIVKNNINAIRDGFKELKEL